MHKIFIVCLALVFTAPVFACSPSDSAVVKERFPVCFADPVIGASSGTKCNYNEAKKEWRITFWHGWGDCPAGCINKEETAWYKVDKTGKVYECDSSFNTKREVPKDEPVKAGSASIKSTGIKKLADDAPQKINTPQTVWIGRSIVVGQCEGANGDPRRGDVAVKPGKEDPKIIEKSNSPGIKPGRKFKTWIDNWEKQMFEADKDGFMCEACYVCHDFSREYYRVHLKDLEYFQDMGWMRLDM